MQSIVGWDSVARKNVLDASFLRTWGAAMLRPYMTLPSTRIGPIGRWKS